MSEQGQKRPTVYWGGSTVALHYQAHGERITKATLMIELPRTPQNEALLVAMANAGRGVLGFLPQGS